MVPGLNVIECNQVMCLTPCAVFLGSLSTHSKNNKVIYIHIYAIFILIVFIHSCFGSNYSVISKILKNLGIFLLINL